MSIERAESLKRELTDKYVVVAADVPELQRFSGLTGQVKTVNMNGRALVEFNGPEDIAWYDIEPTYLTIVEKPVEKPKAAKTGAPAKAAKPAAAKASGKSPLEMARAQDATKASGSSGEKKLSPLEMARQQDAGASSPSAGKKLSPLEMARQQDAGGSSTQQASEKPAAKSSTGKKLSPLEMARQQDSGTASTEAQNTAPQPEADDTPAPQKPAAPKTGADGKPLSILEQARQQGAFKG